MCPFHTIGEDQPLPEIDCFQTTFFVVLHSMEVLCRHIRPDRWVRENPADFALRAM